MREMSCVVVLGTLSLLVVAAFPALGHDGPQGGKQPTGSVTAVRARAPIVVDGRLDDAVWTEAPAAEGFRQRDPDEGQPATERTELKVAYDDDALYVCLRLHDREPQRIVRRLSRRDDDADADRVTVYLDPHHDHLTGVRFDVTAAGVQADAVIYNDSWDDDSWDAVWESAVSVDDAGWNVEVRVPFSQLRFSRADSHTWGINVRRFIQRKNESAWLELVPKEESGLASRMAHLTGLDGIRPRKHVELLPYVVGRSELVAADAGDPFNDGSRLFGDTGLDLKYGLSSSLTLDVTVNPDFGQVEVDAAVVNLTVFETFFEEKRPFFIEGSQIFGNFGRNGANNFWGFNRSEPNLFYSRRIGRSPQGPADGDFVDRPSATTILGAAKLSGKVAGGWSLAALDAVTGREWARVADGGATRREEVEPLTHYFVGRVQREWGRAGLGFLATSVRRDLREPALAERLVDTADVAGVDGYLFLDGKKDWVVNGRLAASRLAGSAAALERIQRAPQHYFQRPDRTGSRLDPEATSLSGWTGSTNLNRNGGNLQVNAALWGTSPGFESNDLGFNSTSGRWGGHAVVSWKKTKPDRFTRFRWIALAKWYAMNFEGDRQGDGINLFTEVELRNYWSIGTNASLRFRAQDDRLTRGGPSMVNPGGGHAGGWARTDSRRRVTLSAHSSYSWNEFGGWGAWESLEVRFKPSSSLSLSVEPSWSHFRSVAQYVRRVTDSSATATFGSRYVFANLDQTEVSMTTRLNWILSPRLSVQVYLQPLISVGDYDGFKELGRPRSLEFLSYGSAGSTLARGADGRYAADPDGPGPAPALSFADPDFNFKSVRLNAVLRWEWRLGSALYVVWTQQREDSAHPGQFRFGRDTGDLLGAPGDDVFLVKFTYRVGR